MSLHKEAHCLSQVALAAAPPKLGHREGKYAKASSSVEAESVGNGEFGAGVAYVRMKPHVFG